MEYTTIRAPASDEFTEKRSRFIGRVIPVDNEHDALAFVEGIRKRHWDASHHAYAYILRRGDQSRCSDGGEPQGTAGSPVLGVLRGEELSDVCAVITRYFGGILLGGGGLARAYSRGAKIAVDAAEKKVLCECATLAFDVGYTLYGKVARLLPLLDAKIMESGFASEVRLTVRLRLERRAALETQLRELSSGTVRPELIGEGFDEMPGP